MMLGLKRRTFFGKESIEVQIEIWFMYAFTGLCLILLSWSGLVKAKVWTDETPWNQVCILTQLGIITTLIVSTQHRKKGQTTALGLRREKERLQATLLGLGAGIIAVDRQGQVELINKAAEELTGWAEPEALGRPLEEVFQTLKEHTDLERDSMDGAPGSQAAPGWDNHMILVDKAGYQRHIAHNAAPIKNGRGDIDGWVLVFQDVTSEKARVQEIEYLSSHDQLTGLYNRIFLERTIRELNTAENLPLSIVLADLDGLRLVNNTRGRNTGDELLRKAAQVITTNARDLGVVGRWGGDEFVILLPRTDSAAAQLAISKVKQSLQAIEVQSLFFSLSFGWATKTEPGQDIAHVFRRAENRMYRSKLCQYSSIRRETIDALMAALFEKNQREEQHSQRVSELCQVIGKAMGLDDWKVEELGLIGLFHDIGKIAVDETILNKPTPLDEDEWQEVRCHPEVGYRLLSGVQDMFDIAAYVLAHHERWDGQGYPHGLEGKEIPLESRIVSIADAYDAMISYRPYRESLSTLEAVEELRRGAGTQFDPKITRVFLDLIEHEKGCVFKD